MRIEIVHSLDPELMRLLRRGVGLLDQLEKGQEKMAKQTKDLATQLAADAQGERDAFTAIKATMATQAAALKDALDKIAAGADNDDPEVLALLGGVHDSLTGTNAEMVAAAQLANTPASGTVPAPAAEAAAAAATS